MHPAGEAVGRFRGQVLRPRGAPDVDHIPGGTFQQDVAGSIGHFRLEPTHHAGQREDAGFITNEDGIFIKFAIDIIQGYQRLAISGGAGNDLNRFSTSAFLQHIIIEGMQRFAQLQHGVVRGIHHVVDGAHSGEFEAVLHI